jgi:DNA-binding NtrC family response regulator
MQARTAVNKPRASMAVKYPMDGDKAHLLLIDDDESVGRMLEIILRDQGYTVTYYTDLQQAMVDFTGGCYDLVISDVKMSPMSGLDVLRRIEERAVTVPVILITGYATAELSAMAHQQGAHALLAKPFEPRELLSTVHDALLRSADTRE